jgi:hypothetical protein
MGTSGNKSGWLKRFLCRWRHGYVFRRREVNLLNPRQMRAVCGQCGTVHAATK